MIDQCEFQKNEINQLKINQTYFNEQNNIIKNLDYNLAQSKNEKVMIITEFKEK